MVEQEQIRGDKYPTVTVQVCTYGQRGMLLTRALESLLKQTYDDFDVFIISDGPVSEENALACAKVYEKFQQRGVELYLAGTEEASGYYTIPRNYILPHCDGDYIVHLDDDNELVPDAVESLVAAMEDGTEWPDFVYGRREYVIDEGCAKEGSDGRLLPVGESQLQEMDELGRARLAQSPMANFIDTSDFIIGQGLFYYLAYNTGMLWNEGQRRFGDWELMTRGVHHSGWKGKALDKVVQVYHWNDENVSLNRGYNETPRDIDIDDVEVE